MTAAYDFVVCGTGSGGGVMLMQLVLRFPFSTVLGLDLGKYLATPTARRADFTQSLVDDVLGKTIPFYVDTQITNYGTDPGSPYFGSGYPFYTIPSEQGMGKLVGGSSMHNGVVAGRGSPEDYDEWDYLLRNGQSDFVIPGTISWPVGPVSGSGIVLQGDAGNLSCNHIIAASAAVETAPGSGIWIPAKHTFISETDSPSGLPTSTPPVRVTQIDTTLFQITVTTECMVYGAIVAGTGVEVISGGGVAVNTNVLNTPWNRTRALECYMEVENDVDTDRTDIGPGDVNGILDVDNVNPNGVPFASHGPNAGYMHLGRIGRRRTQTLFSVTVLVDGVAGGTVNFNFGLVILTGGADFNMSTGTTAGDAASLAAAINANLALDAAGITATVQGGVVFIRGATSVVVAPAGGEMAGAAQPWVDTRPGVSTPRQGLSAIAGAYSLVNSAAGGFASSYNPDANAWAPRVSGPGQVAVIQYPLNYVGFPDQDTSQEPVAGGHQCARLGRYDKYDERRGSLVASIDLVRNYRIVTVTSTATGDGIPQTAGNALVAGDQISNDLNAAAGTVIAADVRVETFYVSDPVFLMAFAALPAGTVISSGLKSGTLIQAPSIVLDSMFAPHVQLTIALTAGSDSIDIGDPVDVGGGPPGPSPVDAPFLGSDFTFKQPTLIQRAQIEMTTFLIGSDDPVEFQVNATLSIVGKPGAAGQQILTTPITSMTIVDHALVDRLLLQPAPAADMILTAVIGAVTVGDDVTGAISGATGTVSDVTTINGIAGRAYVRVSGTSGTFLAGEEVSSVGGGWTAMAFKIDSVQRVTGVAYKRHNHEYTVSSSNVVASLGAFATPALLQRSGIGPRDRLAPAGVEQIVNLPGVGDRCITHSFAFTGLFVINPDINSLTTYFLSIGGAARSTQNRAGLGWEVGANNPAGPLLFDSDYDIALGVVPVGDTFGGDVGPATLAFGYGLGNKQEFAAPQIQAFAGKVLVVASGAGDSITVNLGSPFSLTEATATAVVGTPGANQYDADPSLTPAEVAANIVACINSFFGPGITASIGSAPYGPPNTVVQFSGAVATVNVNIYTPAAVPPKLATYAPIIGAPVKSGRVYGVDVLDFKPRSRGRGVFIKSADPAELPTIDHGLLSDWRSKDAEALLEVGDALQAKMFDGNPLFAPPSPLTGDPNAFGSSWLQYPLLTTPAPGFSPVPTTPPADRVNAIVTTAGAAYHAAGTCAMGPDQDPMAVLDERARLRHVIGVRVADNSPYPTHVRFNPHLPTTALAHNIASLIQEDGGC